MTTFLHDLCTHLKDRHGDDLQPLWLILPNKRATVYLRQALMEVYGKPIFAPKVLSFPDLAYSLSQTGPLDQLGLLAKLFKHYDAAIPLEETFGKFYFWGKMLLDDFQDIDRHLVDPKAVFRLVADHQDIDAQFRDFLTEEQKEAIAKFTDVLERNRQKTGAAQEEEFYYNQFRKFEQIYQGFTQELLGEGLAYQGLAFRKAAESKAERPYSKILYAGLNGLNACERKIMSADVKAGIGEIFYDFDRFYVDRQEQEAGQYFRAYRQDPYLKGNLDQPKEYLSLGKKEIQFIGVPLEAGQAKVIGNLLHEENIDLEETAIVLPRLAMLFPLLHAFPPEVPEYNLTMSYPLRQSSVFAFLRAVIRLHETAKKSKQDVLYYHKYLFQVLTHKLLPYEMRNFQDLPEEEKRFSLSAILRNLKQRDAVYINKEKVAEAITKEEHRELLAFLLDHEKAQEEVLDYLQSLILKLRDVLAPVYEEGKKPFELEYLAVFHQNLEELRLSLKREDIALAFEEALALAEQYLRDASLAFVGDPLVGLQVIGVLESVSLTFKHLIIPDMNEEAFPPNNTKGSFIPYSLRKAFGLPIVEDRDAQFAWYFYRLIQRAEKVYLLHNNYNADQHKGYVSRYLYQLEFEHGERNTILKKTVAERFQAPVGLPVVIAKTEAAMQKIAQRVQERGLSVSAFNTWLDCKLKYYFRYVAEMQEAEEIHEELQPNVLGSIFHDTMEKFYEPAVKQQAVSSDFIAERRKHLGQLLDETFKEHVYMQEDEVFRGKHLLARNKILNWLENQLAYDLSRVPFAVLMQEQRIQARFGEEEAWAMLEGKADRIEEKDGEVRIIDYKTGKVNPVFETVEGLFDRQDAKRPKEGLQVLWYSWLFAGKLKEENKSFERIAGCVYPSGQMRNYIQEDASSPYLHQKEKRKKWPITDISTLFQEFERVLQGELYDFFKKEGEFEQTDHTEICENCPYNVICNR